MRSERGAPDPWWRGRAAGPLAAAGLGVFALATRLAVIGKLPTEWDSVNLTLGVDRFDVRQDSPHAPGYWLYVAAARLVRAITPLDAHHSLVLVAAVASAALVAVTYLIGRDVGGAWFGLVVAALVGSSPFVWFYGSIAASYSFDALTGAVLILLALRARPGSAHAVVGAGVLGVAAGFRPTMVLMFAVLVAVVGFRSLRSWRQALAALGAGVAGLAAWLVPMLAEQPGGLEAWRSASNEMFTNAARQTSLLTGSPQGWTNVARAVAATVVAVGPALIVGAVAALVGVALRAGRAVRSAPPRASPISPSPSEPATPGHRGDRRVALALVAAAVPGLAFVALTHFPKSGYVLAFLPAFVILAALPAARLQGGGRVAVCVLVALLVAGNAQRFLGAPGVVPLSLLNRHGVWVAESRLGAPYVVTRTEIRRVDRTSARYDRLRGALDPRTDVVVFDLDHTPGNYRYATWALPEYRIDLIGGGTEWRTAWHRQQRFTTNHRIVVPSGGDVVVAMDEPTGDLDQLIAAGSADAVDVPGGPVAVRVRAGATLFGLPIVEGPPDPTTP